MSTLSHSVITATCLTLEATGSALVSCFQQATQFSGAITVEIMRDVECEI